MLCVQVMLEYRTSYAKSNHTRLGQAGINKDGQDTSMRGNGKMGKWERRYSHLSPFPLYPSAAPVHSCSMLRCFDLGVVNDITDLTLIVDRPRVFRFSVNMNFDDLPHLWERLS